MKALKLATTFGMAALGGAIVCASAADPEAEKVADPELARVERIGGLSGMMFGEHAVSKTDSLADLVITSAVNTKGEREKVRVRAGTVRVFRADASVDEFTRQRGWYWQVGETKGKSQFEKNKPDDNFPGPNRPGALILVVYQGDGVIHWYSLQPDFRC